MLSADGSPNHIIFESQSRRFLNILYQYLTSWKFARLLPPHWKIRLHRFS